MSCAETPPPPPSTSCRSEIPDSLFCIFVRIIRFCSLDTADVASLERFEPRGLRIVLGTVLDSPLPQIIVISCVITELAGFDLFASLEVLPRDRGHLVGSSHPSERCTRLARLVDVRGESDLEKRRDLVSNKKSVSQSSILVMLFQEVLLVPWGRRVRQRIVVSRLTWGNILNHANRIIPLYSRASPEPGIRPGSKALAVIPRLGIRSLIRLDNAYTHIMLESLVLV